jgi:hypothetical protein
LSGVGSLLNAIIVNFLVVRPGGQRVVGVNLVDGLRRGDLSVPRRFGDSTKPINV